MLFWVMLDIMTHIKSANPKVKFLIENVKMKKEFEEYITHHTEQALGEVNKVLINSALVSAQNRNRYYWTNWHVEQPKDRSIVLADIIEDEIGEEHFYSEKSIAYMQRGNQKWQQAGNRRADRYEQSIDKEKSFTLTANMHKGVPYNYFKHDTPQRVGTASDIKGHDYNKRIYSANGKSPSLAAASGGNLEPKILREKSKTVRASGRGSYDRHEWDSISNCHYRKLTPRECARLQTIPEHITEIMLNCGVSNTQLYKQLGNGWTVDVIAHIFSQMELPIQVYARQLNLFEGAA
jgi:DNA (cytosine-5)-methyltransferase 1/DNA (cytosine-5)-methyltransferase 3A